MIAVQAFLEFLPVRHDEALSIPVAARRPEDWLPSGLGDFTDRQTALPRIAKDTRLLRRLR